MNEKSKDMTVEEKEAFDAKKKAAAAAYQARKVAARETITNYLKDDTRIPKEVREAILYISGTGVRSERAGINSELKTLFLEAGSISSVDIFTKFDYGRPTMNAKMKLFLNPTDPKDRIWVIFENGNYVMKGKGENAPKGWPGLLPTEKATI